MFPRVPFIVVDEHERQQIFGLYGNGCNRGCHLCDVVMSNDGVHGLGNPRQREFILSLLDDGMTAEDSKDLSIHPHRSTLHSIVDCFKQPACVLHHADHGLLPRLLDICIRKLKELGSTALVKQLDLRFSSLALSFSSTDTCFFVPFPFFVSLV